LLVANHDRPQIRSVRKPRKFPGSGQERIAIRSLDESSRDEEALLVASPDVVYG